MDVPCGLAAQPDMVSMRHRLEEPNEIKKVPSCGQGVWAQEAFVYIRRGHVGIDIMCPDSNEMN